MIKSPHKLTDRQLLEEIFKAQQEDHQKISKIHSRIRFQFIFNVLKWVLYIGIAIGLYTFAQPYIENTFRIYQNLKEGAESLNEIRSELSNFPFLR